MPIRRLTSRACMAAAMLAVATLAQAEKAPWNGSYVAEGACFCAGSLGQEFDSEIVPTPVGGQSIAQVCERLGSGPELQKVNGKFNFTVYPDAQCGNGPFTASTYNIDRQCLGHSGTPGEDCAAKGPAWNLVDAYAAPATAQIELGISETPTVTGGSRYIQPQLSQKPALQQESTTPSDADQLPGAGVKYATVEEIANARTRSTKVTVSKKLAVHKPRAPIKKPVQTPEQIRARQIEHLNAARERARLREAKAQTIAIVKPEESIQEEPIQSKSLEIATEAAASDAETVIATAPVAAVKLPAPALSQSDDFDYFEGAPVNYDFGGTGLSVAVSKSVHNRVQYLAHAAAADTYQEASLGMGMFFTPAHAQRLTYIASAGAEYGRFNFKRNAIQSELSDAGVYVALATRVEVSRRFELLSGVRYSTFFEGDALVYGAAFFQLTRNLDLTAKAEAGDNDMLGFGIRFHY